MLNAVNSFSMIDSYAINTAELFDDVVELRDVVQSSASFEDEIINNVICEQVRKCLVKVLTEKERDIICKRFGIGTGYIMTLEQIGQEYGVTRERIRQIEAKALRKLKLVGKKYHLEELLAA